MSISSDGETPLGDGQSVALTVSSLQAEALERYEEIGASATTSRYFRSLYPLLCSGKVFMPHGKWLHGKELVWNTFCALFHCSPFKNETKQNQNQ